MSPAENTSGAWTRIRVFKRRLLAFRKRILYNVDVRKGVIVMIKDLGLRLTEARKAANLTQSAVADSLYISAQSVSSWECGASMPDIEKLPELADLYGVTVDWLLRGEITPPEITEITQGLTDRLFSEVRMHAYVSGQCDALKFTQTKKALAYATEKHAGQFRKSASEPTVPYIYHPLLLTCHALALGLKDEDLLSACLLHDTIEDCGAERDDLPVSERAKDAVVLLSKPKPFHKTPEEEHAYYDAIAEDPIASMVKLLDRCNNITVMATAFSDTKMATYIKETYDYVMPLMEHTRKVYPEYSDALFLIKYQMTGVIDALRHRMRRAQK